MSGCFLFLIPSTFVVESFFTKRTSMYDYGIGGQEVPKDASEGIADIPQNRTLLVEKLTQDDPLKPEVVQGLQTVEDVFRHFRPQVETSFRREDGSSVTETLTFNSLADFGAMGITRQSGYLNELAQESGEYIKIMRQLKSNKMIRQVVEDPANKQHFLDVLYALIRELEETK